MEELLQDLFAKFPLAMTVYTLLSGVYMAFCAVATFTKTTADDRFVDLLKRFFSLPVKK